MTVRLFIAYTFSENFKTSTSGSHLQIILEFIPSSFRQGTGSGLPWPVRKLLSRGARTNIPTYQLQTIPEYHPTISTNSPSKGQTEQTPELC